MKRLISFILCLSVLCSLVVISPMSVYAKEQPIKVKLCNYINPEGKWVGEKYIKFDVDPIIVSGRTYVPIRAIAEELGWTVSWESEVAIVHLYRVLNSDFEITQNNQNLRALNIFYNLEAGNQVKNFDYFLYSVDRPFKSENFNWQTSTGQILKNKPYMALWVHTKSLKEGKLQSILTLGTNYGVSPYVWLSAGHYFDNEAIIKDGRTLLPLRAFGEVLGLDVYWNDRSRTVTISA